MGGLSAMAIELPKNIRDQAVASIQRYAEAETGERMGNIAASAWLGYFLEEIGPVIYNKAVADVQGRLQTVVNEVDIDHHEEAFAYWHRRSKSGKGR